MLNDAFPNVWCSLWGSSHFTSVILPCEGHIIFTAYLFTGYKLFCKYPINNQWPTHFVPCDKCFKVLVLMAPVSFYICEQIHFIYMNRCFIKAWYKLIIHNTKSAEACFITLPFNFTLPTVCLAIVGYNGNSKNLLPFLDGKDTYTGNREHCKATYLDQSSSTCLYDPISF